MVVEGKAAMWGSFLLPNSKTKPERSIAWHTADSYKRHW